jgi:hypothetical protein
MANSMNFTKNVLVSKLQEEIKNQIPEIDYITSRNNQVNIFFTKELDSNEEQIVSDIVNAHTNIENPCKIYRYVKKDVIKNHFHNINYKTQVEPRLHQKYTVEKGEVQKVEYYSDEALTDLILVVDVVYIRDTLNFATERTTTRTWIREDGTPHPETKITRKIYTIDVVDRIREAKKRRKNLIDILTSKVLGLLNQTIPDKTAQEIVTIGREFLATHKITFQNYVDDGHEQVFADITNASDFWMENDIGDGRSIRQFILEELE